MDNRQRRSDWFNAEGKTKMINGAIIGIFLVIALISSIFALVIGNIVICIVSLIFILAFSIIAATFRAKSISALGFFGVMLVIISMIGGMSWEFALLSLSVFIPIIIHQITAIIDFYFFVEEDRKNDE